MTMTSDAQPDHEALHTRNAEPAEPPTILVVDDSSVDRRLAGSIVENQLGLKVAYARHGVAALAALANATPPGAILSDLLMPEMDGLELVETVRREYPLIPVVLMTAHGSEDIAVQALKAGAASYVPKKNLPRSLAPTLEQVLTAAKTDRRMHRLLDCATETAFRFSLENDPALIAPTVGHFQDYLELVYGCDQTERTRLGIALEEALLNGLYHGNLEIGPECYETDQPAFYQLAATRRKLSPYRDRRLEVHMTITRRLAEVTVCDEGPGFDVAALWAVQDPPDLGRDAGRGLVLIRHFTDEVIHNSTGNAITLSKRRRPTQEQPQ